MSDISITTDAIDQGAAFATVTLGGELDRDTAAQVRSTLIGLERRGNLQFVIDLTGIVLMDSTGLAVLVGAHKRAVEAGGGLTLVATTEAIRKVLRITGANKTIGVFSSTEEAYATLRQDAAAKLGPAETTDPLTGSGELAWDVQQQNEDGTWSTSRIDYDINGWEPAMIAMTVARTLADHLGASTEIAYLLGGKALRVRVWDAARGSGSAHTATIPANAESEA